MNNILPRNLSILQKLAFEREADYIEAVKSSYNERNKKSGEYHKAMIEIKMKAWINAISLYFTMYRLVHHDLK